MNYVELDLGGKKRGAKLGTLVLRRVCESKKMTPDELFQALQGTGAIFAIPELIYHSLVFNCDKKGEKADFSEEDVFDWIDAVGGINSTVYQTYLDALTKSLGFDMGKEEPQKKVAK